MIIGNFSKALFSVAVYKKEIIMIKGSFCTALLSGVPKPTALYNVV